MSNVITDTRKAIATALNNVTSGETPTPTYTLTNSRIYVGFHSKLSDSTSVAQDVKTNGPMVVIGLTQTLAMDTLRFGYVFFPITVYLYKDKSASFTGEDVENLIVAVFNAIVNPDAYGLVANSKSMLPRTTSLQSLQWDYMDNPGLVAITFQAEVPDP